MASETEVADATIERGRPKPVEGYLMAGNEAYCLTRITGLHSPRVRGSHPNLDSELLPNLRAAGAGIWGAFSGLIGLAADEAFVMTSAPSGTALSAIVQHAVARSPVLSITEQYDLVPTVRPASPKPMEKDGLYVLRFFHVDTKDLDEVVSLSSEGWRTFETSETWESEPMGLFAPASLNADRGALLLVTWYDGFASWEASRAMSPGAAEPNPSFAHRAELTINSIAYATRLARG